MFDPSSRYYNVESVSLSVTEPDGTFRKISYKRRRFIPASDDAPVIAEHIVADGERLDNISAYYLGDPLRFWHICDSNDVLEPEELTSEIGRIIQITLPQF